MQNGKRKFDYKWVILGTSFLMVFVCLGFCSSNKGLYLSAITGALGIPRSLFSINDSLRFITSAVVNLFFGALVAKFGARRMIAFGFLSLISSVLIYAYADKLILFYIGGVLLGAGFAFTSNAMASCIVNRWFKENIGRYTGIVFAANGIGGALSAQIISPMINRPSDPFGYRDSYRLVALILFVTAVIVLLLIREYPKGEVAPANGSEKKKNAPSVLSGISYDNARRRGFFYMAILSVFLTGFVLQGINGVYVAHLEGVGMPPSFIATLVSVLSLILTLSKVVIGFLYDKLGLSPVVVICQGAAVVAFVVMTFVAPGSSGMAFSFVFGILYSLALPLETLVVPLIAKGMFGNVSYDKILGILIAANYTGYALGGPIVNLFYDISGSYTPVFMIFAVLMLLNIPLFLSSSGLAKSSYRADADNRGLEN